MEKIISVILTFVLLFTVTVPAFAAADSSAVLTTAETEENGSFFETVISEIKEFFNRIGVFSESFSATNLLKYPPNLLKRLSLPTEV